ncbi:transglutaminase TgpA family protein [Leeia aquatica]|uniref:DUF3488 domain-containing transglutaminase family protein n=1 Tax=Leeia aquatica TaxID=2725557 RepID=A0A847S3P2_9NEIS|nr:DUF3488 and transglutaminase-like domain-containing protein [Leeia aquatica]NLR74423.1 DUF3488 domain-containing transglutaminase family protein [Leeia aquatica]
MSRPLTALEQRRLLSQLLLVLLPHGWNLPVWLSALVGLALGWQALRLWRRWPPPPRLLLSVISIAALLLVIVLNLRDGNGFNRELAVSILVLFGALKLLESRQLRDAQFCFLLAFFLLLTLFLYGQPFWLAAYVLVSAIFVLRNGLYLCHPSIEGQLSAWRFLGRLQLYGLPWLVVLFVLFPRLDRPLWQLQHDPGRGITGVSDLMSPGNIGQLIRSTEVAFRAEFSGARPSPDELYWRGLVLWDYDGRSWLPSPERRAFARDIPAAAIRYRYRVTLEPHQQRWLYLLDRGQQVLDNDRGNFTLDGEYFRQSTVDSRMMYRATAVAEDPEVMDTPTLQQALYLPPGNPQARALAARWASLPTPQQRVNAALALFRQAPFGYTLEPPPLGKQAVDDFLFRTRLGFCEHYSSSFVFLMRASGVPARVVVGYLGGEYNTLSNYYIVRQADAHAWAEVWLAGRGWVRVDPTAAVSPDRVDQGIAAAINDAGAQDIRALRTPDWMRSLRWGVDGLVNGWNKWILSYDSREQLGMLERLGLESNAMALARLLGLVLASLLLLATLPLLRQRGPKLSPLQAAYQQLCLQLAKAGCPRQPQEGPLDYAARLSQAFPYAARELQSLLTSYARLYYGAAVSEQAMQAWAQRARRYRLPRP